MKEWIELKIQSTNPEALFGVLYQFDCLGIKEDKNSYCAYFSEDKTDVNVLLTSLNTTLQHEVSLLSVNKVFEENWNTRWQEFFGPQYIGKNLLVLPPWISLSDADKNRMIITINPGMAFGTGIHPTTRICLEFLEAMINPAKSESVLDVGCGSGILSIASKKLGARSVVGIDISEDALEASIKNIAYNDVDGIDINGKPIETIADHFDIVVTNMLLGEIISIRDELKRRLKRVGHLIISGILQEQEAELFASLGNNLKCTTKKTEGEWLGFIFQNKHVPRP